MAWLWEQPNWKQPRKWDCIVSGSCTIDVLVRPVELERAIGREQLVRVEPLQLTTGGIVANAGIAMARLGLRVAAWTAVGDDVWGEMILARLGKEGIDTRHLAVRSGVPSSATVALIASDGQRSFLHCQGAPKQIAIDFYRERLDLAGQAHLFLLGYYSLIPNLEDDLVELLEGLRMRGCATALDAAGSGGSMEPLAQLLPHLDFYIPSLSEARHQTGLDDPRAIISLYRSLGAPGLLGIKLGERGSILSPASGQWLEVPPARPPGPVVDTTGAGDSFYAGLIAGLRRGETLPQAARIASATGACCVTALGASTAIPDYSTVRRIAAEIA